MPSSKPIESDAKPLKDFAPVTITPGRQIGAIQRSGGPTMVPIQVRDDGKILCRWKMVPYQGNEWVSAWFEPDQLFLLSEIGSSLSDGAISLSERIRHVGSQPQEEREHHDWRRHYNRRR